MPTFELNKLVRDKLPNEYSKNGQEAKYKELSLEQYQHELINKIIEEATELGLEAATDKVISEIADIRQVLADLMKTYGIEEDQVIQKQLEKLEKIGGFSDARYVTTIELAEQDEWVKYYRKKPDVYPEKNE